jgi:hypothetical protein
MIKLMLMKLSQQLHHFINSKLEDELKVKYCLKFNFYLRLINAYAEEAAIEDTIYYLGEGLRKGVIDLDVFLRQVRDLSRKQFMFRALMQKCRQKAGLAS